MHTEIIGSIPMGTTEILVMYIYILDVFFIDNLYDFLVFIIFKFFSFSFFIFIVYLFKIFKLINYYFYIKKWSLFSFSYFCKIFNIQIKLSFDNLIYTIMYFYIILPYYFFFNSLFFLFWYSLNNNLYFENYIVYFQNKGYYLIDVINITIIFFYEFFN